MKTKPFDIEKAKAGNPVCTRDLRPARIICYDQKDGLGNEYLTVLVSDADGYEMAYTYRRDGTFGVDNDRRNFDLQLAAVKKTGWINIYHSQKFGLTMAGEYIFDTEEDAKRQDSKDPSVKLLDTVKIEWEE